MSLQPQSTVSRAAEPLKIWNCITCRKRKVRCDRRHPCTPCIKNNAECVFPISGRIPRRNRDANGAPVQKQAELVGRLRRLEAMVGGLSSKVENATAVDQASGHVEDLESSPGGGTTGGGSWQGSAVATDTSQSSHVPDDPDELQLDANGHIVIGKGFWTVFCKEVEDIFEAVNGHTVLNLDEDGDSSVPGNSPHTGYYNFLVRSTSALRQTQDVHPLPSQMLFLWQIYTDNVVPFINILHVPTMANIIRGIRGSYAKLGSSMQALVLAVSLAAVMTLDEEEVDGNFNTSKDQLMARFRLGTEQALQQADVLNTSDMTALQAFAIYISFLQHTGETKPAWRLAGILVRVAVSMKLHSDSSHFPTFTPFEAELRRRLWWLICFIDSRADDTQVSEFKIREGMFDTKMPTNADSVNPGVPLYLNEVEGWTEMTPFLIRCEIWKLSRQIQSIKTTGVLFSIDQQYKVFQQSQAKIQDTYLKHANPNEPLHAFVATSARLFLTKIELILSTKQHSIQATEPQSDQIFMSSLSILEYTWALRNEPSWAGWRWQIEGRQPPWHALRILLHRPFTRSWKPTCSGQAWSSAAIAKKTFDSLPEEARGDKRYLQIQTLIAAVERRAEEQAKQVGDSTSPSDSSLTAQSVQNGGDNHSIWMPQDPAIGISDDMASFSNDPGQEMDWQVWDEIAGGLEFWDMGATLDGSMHI